MGRMTEIRRSAKYRAIDLFAGAGGLSYAFHRCGFQIIYAVENNTDAASTYRTSFIQKYSPWTQLCVGDMSDQSVLDTLHLYTGQADIVIGGPPCQDFSPARLKTRRSGRRASLVNRYFDAIRIIQPKAFVFENVPNIKKAAKGKYWARVKDEAEALGFRLTTKILNAEDFGIPQRRKRLFVVGARDDDVEIPDSSRAKTRTVMDVIGKLPPLSAGEVSESDAMHRARNHRPHMVSYFSQIPQGGGWRDAPRRLPCQEGHTGHYDTYGRMEADGIAPTLTGGCTNPSKGRFIHPTQDRGLTVREAALLQTFPKTWHFQGGIESQSLQVGNAVPVKLGEAVARSVHRHLEGL